MSGVSRSLQVAVGSRYKEGQEGGFEGRFACGRSWVKSQDLGRHPKSTQQDDGSEGHAKVKQGPVRRTHRRVCRSNDHAHAMELGRGFMEHQTKRIHMRKCAAHLGMACVAYPCTALDEGL